jgi:predicted GNAT family acetyltransferase
MTVVTQDPAQSRFTATVDGVLCVLDYQLQGDTMVIVHTGVPSPVGGIAAELTKFALDTARTQGWKVRPVCSYAEVYMRRHPEYNDLRA